jgi:aspartate racemase
MPSPPAWTDDEAALLERNPLLREVGRAAPDRLPLFLAQLNAILRRPRMRGGTPAGKGRPLTPRERAALDANPDIADAIRIAPDRMGEMLQTMLDVTQQQVIGLIGGMGWESSAEYYRIISQTARAQLGVARSARVLMWSFGFGEIEALQHVERWDEAVAPMADAARRLKQGGADLIVICSSTMHQVADQVQAAVDVPLLHIADPTADRIKGAGLQRIGLLGTAPTMEQDFYKGRLCSRHGLDVLVPDDEKERAEIHRVIVDELVQGRVEPKSRDACRGVMAHLVERGAEAVILGCTEMMLLVCPEDSTVRLFDTAAIHAKAAVERALAG